MKRLVLGIDGGGTKTQCALYDINGNELDIVDWGPTNHELLKGGYRGLKMELAILTNFILKKHGINLAQIKKGVFGMAGVDTKEQHSTVSGIFREIGFEDFLLCNDAYLGIKAGSPCGYGIGVVNGTGCCVAGIGKSGRMFQIGGQGNLTGDLGGGVHLGEQAIRSVYDYFFRCGEYTMIKELLPESLNTASKYEFMDNVREKLNKGEINIADLNRLVFEGAKQGDRVSIGLLEAVGSSLAASVNGMIRELQFDREQSVTIVLTGSINTRGSSPALVDRIKRDVVTANKDTDIKMVLLGRPPVLGAVIWAMEDLADKRRIDEVFFAEALKYA